MLVVPLPTTNIHCRSNLKPFRCAQHLDIIKDFEWVMILHQQRGLVLLVERIVFTSLSACDSITLWWAVWFVCSRDWWVKDIEKGSKEKRTRAQRVTYSMQNSQFGGEWPVFAFEKPGKKRRKKVSGKTLILWVRKWPLLAVGYIQSLGTSVCSSDR